MSDALELMGVAQPTYWWFGTDLAWQTQAACGKTDNADSFFPGGGRPSNKSKRICAGCPVRAACLAWAIENGEEGIWGGLTERERQRLTDSKRSHLHIKEHQ